METQKFNIAAIFAIALTAMVITALAVTSLIAYYRAPNYGSVKAVKVGVYSDKDCKNNLTSIDWGLLAPGTTSTKIIWIKNIGNTKITLNMTTDNWKPINASNYVKLNWNCTGQVLNVNQTIRAALTMNVLEAVKETEITEFSFDIVIIGTENTS